jgi:protein arginine kinase activator
MQQPAGGGVLPSWALGVSLAVPNPSGRSRCPTCGFRWNDFERLHRLGCPTCYESHQAEALATIARLQPGMAHQGRRPQASPAERRARLAKAQADLQTAIAGEDYETAAGLRDLIRELQAGLGELQA